MKHKKRSEPWFDFDNWNIYLKVWLQSNRLNWGLLVIKRLKQQRNEWTSLLINQCPIESTKPLSILPSQLSLRLFINHSCLWIVFRCGRCRVQVPVWKIRPLNTTKRKQRVSIIHLRLDPIVLDWTDKQTRLHLGNFQRPIRVLCPPSLSHRGPHPADSVGLCGSRAELVESQGRRGAGEQSILKQFPALEGLGFETLVILTQKLHGPVVLSQTFIAVPLAPQPSGHACCANGLLHPELAELPATGSTCRSLLDAYECV